MKHLPAAHHSWLPRASCDSECVRVTMSRPLAVASRVLLRSALALLVVPALPVLAIPLPERFALHRAYCRLMLCCFGVRIRVSGGPVRNLRGVLVVSGHVSWLDVFVIGAVLPGSFVARADMVTGPWIGLVGRAMKVIPIERSSLRRLPGVVHTVADRLRAGRTVVAFPEGTTWCGMPGDHVGGAAGQPHRGFGSFYPAMFQAAIDAGRPVQPLRLTYHHPDGTVSTIPAYVGDDGLCRSICRVIAARRTLARVHIGSLQLSGSDRRELARRCQTAVHASAAPQPSDRQPLSA